MKWQVLKSAKEKPGWKPWLKSLLQAACFVLVIRNFFFTLLVVRSDSMQPVLMQGDCIWINEWAYGPRIPSTPVCIPFTDIYFKQAEIPVYRIPGYSTPALNEIVVFNLPHQHGEAVERKKLVVKRIMGKPGDTLEIINGQFRVNGTFGKQHPWISDNYRITTPKGEKIKEWFIKNGVTYHSEMQPGEWVATLSQQQVKKLKRKLPDLTVQSVFLPAGENENIFTGKLSGYSRSHFAATWIPKKGSTISLNMRNLQLYGHCLELEGHRVTSRQNIVWIDGKKQEEYTFAMNYYFVAGDARSVSVDSRYFGFVPENHLAGKVSFVLYSMCTGGGIRWSRIFKKVN